MNMMLRLSPVQLKTYMDRLNKTLPVRRVEKLRAHAPVIGGDAAIKANKALEKPKSVSRGEEGLKTALRATNAPSWVSEYRFDPKRRWRADLAFLEARLLVEVEGGSFSQGRHVRGAGFEADCEKYAEALCQGWRVLRVTTAMVEDGRALGYIMRALGV